MVDQYILWGVIVVLAALLIIREAQHLKQLDMIILAIKSGTAMEYLAGRHKKKKGKDDDQADKSHKSQSRFQ
ncbi:MAG: hypothetical protein RDU76_06300 [Candidatus Edwardsbacteria bacterium]|nr:hypothetical protein [Candidatus Edwardsbacteria bacterium]